MSNPSKIKMLQDALAQSKNENKRLEMVVGQKDKEIERVVGQKDKELSFEHSLWKTRHNTNIQASPENAALLHRLETLDGIINNKKLLRGVTSLSKEVFEYLLDNFEKEIKKYKDAPLFRNNESRAEDPGNRCKLYPRHALLMCLIRFKGNRTQEDLAAFFGIDQSSVCDYLKFCNKILGIILPTPHKISKAISNCKTAGELKEFISGNGAGVLLVDGTHIPVLRSGDKDRRKETYSGKKKRHTLNTTITTATNNIILGLGNTVVGKTHDLTLLKEDSLPFGRWAKKMHDGDAPAKEKFTVYMDLGYLGIQNAIPGANVIMPHKRPRKKKGEKKRGKLTAVQKKHNKKVSSIRVTVENSIGRLKQYARMSDPYDGTEDELNYEMNIVAGLVNLHLMMTLRRGSTKMRKRFCG